MNPGFIHQFATEGIISPESTQVVFHFCHEKIRLQFQSIFQPHHKLGTLFWSLPTFCSNFATFLLSPKSNTKLRVKVHYPQVFVFQSSC